ncbi:MAG TPA: hypothetical protein VIJ59_01950 [Caulobacteraceae bacterium]
MLVGLYLPRLLPEMTVAIVEAFYPVVGDSLAAGAKILDLSIDLGAGFQQDCPPISHYRLISRENLRLRTINAEPGDALAPGSLIAVFGDDLEPAEIARPLRVAIAGIVSHAGMWSARVRA